MGEREREIVTRAIEAGVIWAYTLNALGVNYAELAADIESALQEGRDHLTPDELQKYADRSQAALDKL